MVCQNVAARRKEAAVSNAAYKKALADADAFLKSI